MNHSTNEANQSLFSSATILPKCITRIRDFGLWGNDNGDDNTVLSLASKRVKGEGEGPASLCFALLFFLFLFFIFFSLLST